MAAEGIVLTLTTEGADKASSDLEGVARSAGKVKEGAADAAAKWGALGSAFGLVGRAISAQNQGLGQLVGTLGQGVSMVATLRNSLGSLGGAVGLAATAFGVYEQALAESTRRVEEMRRASDALIPSLDSVIARLERQQALGERAARIAAGQGTGAEQRAYAEVTTAERTWLERVANGTATEDERGRFIDRYGDPSQGATRSGGIFGIGAGTRTLSQDEFRTARSMLERARSRAGQADYDVSHREIVMEPENISGSTRRRRGGGRARQADSSWMNAGIAEKQANQSVLAADADREEQSLRDRQRAGEEAARKQRELEEEDRRRGLEGLEATARREQELHDEKMKRLDEWGAKGEAVASTLYDAFETVASGQATLAQAAQNLFKQTLQQFAKSEMLEAGKEIGLALGSLAVENYPGAAKHFASAAQHGLVAAAAGVGAVAIGSAGGGGGGARSNARPESAGRGSGSGSGGPTTVVVNLPATTILAGTYADAGRMVSRALRAEMVTYGTGIAA